MKGKFLISIRFLAAVAVLAIAFGARTPAVVAKDKPFDPSQFILFKWFPLPEQFDLAAGERIVFVHRR